MDVEFCLSTDDADCLSMDDALCLSTDVELCASFVADFYALSLEIIS